MSFSAKLLMIPDWQALLVVLAAIVGPFFGGRCHVWGATRVRRDRGLGAVFRVAYEHLL